MFSARGVVVVLLESLVLAGCTALSHSSPPAIAFTKIPAFGEGHGKKMDGIEGTASGTRAGQRIILYARAGDWWIQPLASAYNTEIHSGHWANQTHPGSAYAALLVTADYHPPLRVGTLPETGGPILAVATVDNPARVPRKTLRFAGYEWEVRQSAYSPGGTRNEYSPQNAWVDSDGLLHLRISGRPGHWSSAELLLLRSLGYGSYRFVIRNGASIEPSAVFAMSLLDNAATSHEMDVEISKWGETFTRNGQFVIQPYDVAANTVQFDVPPGTATFMWRWSPNTAAMRAFAGVSRVWDAPHLRDHVFTSSIPSAETESVRMNLYVFDGNRNPLKRGSEVTIEAFEYLP